MSVIESLQRQMKETEKSDDIIALEGVKDTNERTDDDKNVLVAKTSHKSNKVSVETGDEVTKGSTSGG